MPWKMEGETLVVQDGKPVYVYPETAGKDFAGKEVPFDADQATSKISSLNVENRDWRTKHGEIAAKYEPWKGLMVDDQPAEPTDVLEALQTVKNLKDRKLFEAGEVQKIKDDEATRYKGEITSRDTTIKGLKDTLTTERKGWAFANSKFVREKLDMPPHMAMKLFGDQFQFEDGEEGRPPVLVGLNKSGKKISSPNRVGEDADFDEALEAMVNADEYKDRLLRSDGAGGSGAVASAAAGRRSAGDHRITREEAKDPAKYRAAKEKAGKAGAELQIID